MPSNIRSVSDDPPVLTSGMNTFTITTPSRTASSTNKSSLNGQTDPTIRENANKNKNTNGNGGVNSNSNINGNAAARPEDSLVPVEYKRKPLNTQFRHGFDSSEEYMNRLAQVWLFK